ncbi:hypothetical protein SNE40_010495 [Patella caerulea]|uniref:Globin n=2 Tax=Patella caerulea TaxID=87958 RepID=A0AAN8JUL2_PATCE
MTTICNMGCGSSQNGTTGSETMLTKQDEELIRTSWAEFKNGDVVMDGLHMYYRFFETNPEAKEFFGFAKEGEVNAENNKFRAHVKNVFDIVGGAVDGMDNITEVKEICYDLGVRHKAYGVPSKYFKVVGNSLIYALDRKLHLDSNTKKAWVRLYSIIESEAKRGMAAA